MTKTTEFLDKKRIAHTVSADGFITIHGDLELRENDITLADIEAIDGNLYVYGSTKLEALTTVGGNLYVYGSAKLEAPALTTVGEVRMSCDMLGYKITVIDGMGAVVISEKQKDGIVIKYCRKSEFKDGQLIGETFYVASNGTENAHGESILEATNELAFKTGDRDVSQYKNLPLDTVKTPDEWALAYRVITGACRFGTKKFMEQQKLKESYTLSEIIKLTAGAFGNDTFSKFFKSEKEAI